jgi:ribokinase
MEALNVNLDDCRYKVMIGTGGIGSGMFFQLNGDHTLGREESRSGYFLDKKDYCKLHIISHYVQRLLGKNFPVIPVGKVGNDDVGKKMLAELEETGFVMDFVEQSPNDQTLFSFCFIYPDGSGGNMTTSDSACAHVDSAFIAKAESKFNQFSGQGVALAAPEVPLEARIKLLDLGTTHNFFRVASFTSEEIGEAVNSGLFLQIDLVGINLDEAAAAVGMSVQDNTPTSIIEKAVNTLTKINPKILVSVTQGKNGSWSWDGSTLHQIPVFPVQIQNTAGAGDAHLAGLIVGLTIGLSMQEAQQLATLTGGSSVESPHTINHKTDRKSLRILADRSPGMVDKNVYKFLED